MIKKENKHVHDEKCNLYGLDMHSENITPEQVRDAIVQCFLAAHAEVLADLRNYGNVSNGEFKKIKDTNVELLVKNFFKEVGGDYNKPDKDSLIRVVNKLAEFSKNFRNDEVVKKHQDEITALINKL